MRKIALVALATLMIASAAFAQSSTSTTTYTQTVYPYPGGGQGQNLICLKGVPLEPDPLAQFDSDWNVLANGVFWNTDLDTSLNLIEGKLSKFDAVGGSQPGYSISDPASFGKCLLGEGYMLMVTDDVTHTISYNGIANGVPDAAGAKTDMWISLPGKTGQNGGDHWIGNPFNHEVYWLDVKVTDGTKTIPVYDEDPGTEDAVNLGWLEGSWLYFKGAVQGEERISTDGSTGSWNLWPGHMYLVKTMKSNIALIIPATPSPYPDGNCDEVYPAP